jgi:D-alanine-D-alanine ligase
MGGDSAEREVSLNSGKAVHRALLDAGVDAIPVDLRDCDFHRLAGLEVDRVFNVLHGRGGEDGTIRAVLDFLGIPSTGSGVCAAALTMNKVLTKKVIRCSGIPTPDFFELRGQSDCQRLLAEFGLPVFVKPVAEGSSIGMTPVYQADELMPAWEAASHYGAAFAEKLVDGGEYTAGFICGEVLPLIKLETPREFYDYEAKYLADDTVYTCPSGLADSQVAEINEIALQTGGQGCWHGNARPGFEDTLSNVTRRWPGCLSCVSRASRRNASSQQCSQLRCSGASHTTGFSC